MVLVGQVPRQSELVGSVDAAARGAAVCCSVAYHRGWARRTGNSSGHVAKKTVAAAPVPSAVGAHGPVADYY